MPDNLAPHSVYLHGKPEPPRTIWIDKETLGHVPGCEEVELVMAKIAIDVAAFGSNFVVAVSLADVLATAHVLRLLVGRLNGAGYWPSWLTYSETDRFILGRLGVDRADVFRMEPDHA